MEQKIRDYLVDCGYKLTRQRRAIAAVLAEDAQTALTAQQIFRRVSNLCWGTNFSTIYRNLELLVDLKVLAVIALDGSRAYVLRLNREHDHHLVCKRCGCAQRMSFCPVIDLPEDKLDGFVPTEHRFEIFGYCRQCSEKAADV